MSALTRFSARLPIADRVVPPVDDVVGGVAWLVRSAFGRVPPSRFIDVLEALRSTAIGLGTLFSLHAAIRPDAVAIYDASGETTFAELNVRVNRLANALDGDGCTQGGRLAFVLPNCREAIEAFGAAAKLGMVPVPVNTRFHPEEIDRLLRAQDVQAVLVDSGRRREVADFDGTVIERGDDYEARLAGADPEEPPRPRRREIAPAVIHTSGTTGHPKGAERALTNSGVLPILSFFSRVPVSSNDTIVVPAPLFHALGLIGAAVGFAFGAELVLQEQFDPREFLSLIRERNATAAVLVPIMLRRIVDTAETDARTVRHDGVRWLLVSGAELPTALERRSREVFGPVVRNLYGSTEAGWVSIATPDDSDAYPGTVGRPITGVAVEVVDDEGRTLPAGEVGEICVRSKAVFSGYTEDLATGTGPGVNHREDRYHLGDAGYLDEHGYLYVVDRKDDMVVTGGENVYPAEVERVFGSDARVKEAAVVGTDDEEYGKILVAFAVPTTGVDVTPADLETHLRAHLANYKVPKHIWLVESLPYNATGKVLRRVLREDAQARLQQPGRQAAGTPDD